jgi:hypothetical protein
MTSDHDARSRRPKPVRNLGDIGENDDLLVNLRTTFPNRLENHLTR